MRLSSALLRLSALFLLFGSVRGFNPTKPAWASSGPLFYIHEAEVDISIGHSTKPLIKHRETFDREAWQKGFSTVEREDCFELPATFPSDLIGTFYQNGHGRFEVGDEQIMHPFDGDGMLTAVTFDKGKAWFRNRFVETPGFLEELKQGIVCYRGMFGTARNRGAWFSNIFDLECKNVANTHAMYFNNKLYALWEGGMPFELDPVTLETVAESDFNGTLPRNSRYAAHYKVDPSSGNYCGFSVGPGKITTMEHRPNGTLVYRKTHEFKGVGFFHDMAITDEAFIFLKSPASLDPLPYLLGLKGIAQCINFDVDDHNKTCSQLLLIPRGKGEPVSIDIPKGYAYHLSNAFQDNFGNLVVDIVFGEKVLMNTKGRVYPKQPLWETMDLCEELSPYQLTRFRVNRATANFISQERMTHACKSVDFPVVHPNRVGKPYKYAYCLGSPGQHRMSALQALAKVDVEAGQIVEKFLPEPHQFLSEVSFAPRQRTTIDEQHDEDDGYLIGYMLDAARDVSSLVVFDAKHPSWGPIVKADLKYKIPFSLHGTFVPNLTPKLTDEVRKSFPPNRLSKDKAKSDKAKPTKPAAALHP